MIRLLEPQPGDLLLTRGAGWASAMIRLGAAFRDEPNMVNHVAVVHHTDAQGTLWCIEGRPGGVGWRDAHDYLGSRYTVANVAQPKSAGQREAVCEVAHALLGTPYDWQAIVKDCGNAFGLAKAWSLKWAHGTVPAHVVCSSLAAYGYSTAKLLCPSGDREVSPADWLKLWTERGWS